VTGKGSMFVSTVGEVISDWAVVSGSLLAVFNEVCVWMDSGSWSPGCLGLQLAAMVVIEVIAECWISNGKGRNFKDAEFETTGRERQRSQAPQPRSAW
jgi:hypothetical protein